MKYTNVTILNKFYRIKLVLVTFLTNLKSNQTFITVAELRRSV